MRLEQVFDYRSWMNVEVLTQVHWSEFERGLIYLVAMYMVQHPTFEAELVMQTRGAVSPVENAMEVAQMYFHVVYQPTVERVQTLLREKKFSCCAEMTTAALRALRWKLDSQQLEHGEWDADVQEFTKFLGEQWNPKSLRVHKRFWNLMNPAVALSCSAVVLQVNMTLLQKGVQAYTEQGVETVRHLNRLAQVITEADKEVNAEMTARCLYNTAEHAKKKDTYALQLSSLLSESFDPMLAKSLVAYFTFLQGAIQMDRLKHFLIDSL